MHYLKGNKDYLISWDNYTIDSPVLDLINLYKMIIINMNLVIS